MWTAGLIGGNSKQPKVEEEPADDHETPWTLDEVKKYDGKGPDGKIYISCNGKVFDVTQSYNYQEGGDYQSFGGHDISIACAHYSTEDKWLDMPYNPDNNKLTFSQQQNIQDFYMGFCQKYRVMGRIVEWEKESKKND